MKIQEFKMLEFIKSKPNRLREFTISHTFLKIFIDNNDVILDNGILYLPFGNELGQYYCNDIMENDDCVYKMRRI